MGALGSYLFGLLVLLMLVSGNFLYKNPEANDIVKSGMENIIPLIVLLLPAMILMVGHLFPTLVFRLIPHKPDIRRKG